MTKHPAVIAFERGRSQLKRHKLQYYDNFVRPKAACHVGALYFGATEYSNPEELPHIADLVAELFPELRDTAEKSLCTCYEGEDRTFMSALIHYNDYHNFSTAKISKWLQDSLTNRVLRD